MKIHEYQARGLLSQFGIPVPEAVVAETAEQAAEAYLKLQPSGEGVAVVKAQVHAGGRGKGGGVKLVRSREEAQEVARVMLNHPLITPQTGPAGVPVRKVLVAMGVVIAREYYVGVAVDRALGAPVVIASARGGMEIEQIAAQDPRAIVRQAVNPLTGLAPYQGRKLAAWLGLRGELAKAGAQVMRRLVDLFLNTDATLVEINPLVVTDAQGAQSPAAVLALDAKMSFDDSALFRHPELAGLADPSEEVPAEQRARQAGLSYIKLDGNIGCLVNGAGLAMATMDLIKLHGGGPANFLDVGGSASQEAVTQAFGIILSDPRVRGVLVNIFGGIMRCDVIAGAIVAAAREVGFSVPLVVRLQGTNVELAGKILEQARADLPTLRVADDLTEAAAMVCSLRAAG
jgi:succinyl-CoA synthetase beta subunit